MTNAEFCYWLQGFFEISRQVQLDKHKIILIEQVFKKINEPLGVFTQWFAEVLVFLKKQNYQEASIHYFLPEIQKNLNSIFEHVIDNSYDTDLSPEYLKKIHDGKNHDK